MFNALSENVDLRGIALLDGDKGLPAPNRDNPQDFVRFEQLACHETENLYLTDEVLAVLGLTWDQARAKIAAEAANYGQKADALRAVAALANVEGRRRADIKGAINQIAEILDSKKLLCSVRLGKVLADRVPEGMLREWLGGCADFIWPRSRVASVAKPVEPEERAATAGIRANRSFNQEAGNYNRLHPRHFLNCPYIVRVIY